MKTILKKLKSLQRLEAKWQGGSYWASTDGDYVLWQDIEAIIEELEKGGR